MIEDIQTLLKQQNITLWKLTIKDRQVAQYRSAQSGPFQADGIRAEQFPREGHLTVFHEYFARGRKFLGRSSLQFVDPIDPSQFSAALAKAVLEAQNDDSPWFPLRQNGTVPAAGPQSSLGKKDLEHWLQPLHEACQRAALGQEFSLGTNFIQLEKETRIYLDNFGTERVQLQHRGRVEAELVLEGEEPARETACFDFAEFGPEKLAKVIQAEGRHFVASRQAEPFAGELPPTVYLRGPLIPELFSWLFRKLAGSQLYSGQSRLTVGQPLWNLPVSGDAVSLEALPSLYDSPLSDEFDAEGLPLQKYDLVRDGVVCGIQSDQASAHYLALPLTGLARNFSVAGGSLDLGQFSGAPYLEIDRVGPWQLDEATGDFAGQVSLALWFDGQKTRPVKGLKLKTNLRTLLTESRFSHDIWSWEYFEGPEILQIPARCVVKEDR